MRVEVSPGISNHMAKLVRICMNEDPGKRPSFEQVIPILEKMKKWRKNQWMSEDHNHPIFDVTC